MEIDVQWFHVEVDQINDCLLAFILMVIPLLLIVLELDDLSLFERILIIKQSLDQLIDTILLIDCQIVEILSWVESSSEGNQKIGKHLHQDDHNLTIFLSNGLVEMATLNIEVHEYRVD